MKLSKLSCLIVFSSAAIAAQAAEEPNQADYAKCFSTPETDSLMNKDGFTRKERYGDDRLVTYTTGDSGVTAYVYDFPGGKSCVIGSQVRDTDPVQLKKFYDLQLDRIIRPRHP